MYSLLNRGIIPRDVDLSPAFERNSAPFSFNKANLNYKTPARPPQLSKLVVCVFSRSREQNASREKTRAPPPAFCGCPEGDLDVFEKVEEVLQNATI